jgi:CHAT domain
MNWTITVASSEPEQLAELKNGAEEIREKIQSSGAHAIVQTASSVDEVKSLRRGADAELIIVTASLAERQAAPNAQSLPGLRLLREFQRTASPPACILVSERPEHWGEVQTMKRCRWLSVGPTTDYIDDCVFLAKQLEVWTAKTAPRTTKSCDPYALMEVDLPSEARHATVRWVIRDAEGKVNSSPTSPLGLNQRRVDELVEQSRKLSDRFSRALKSTKKYEQWQMDYRALGESFYKLLDTNIFAAHLDKVTGAGLGGLDVRLRFSLGRLVFDGLWESICRPGDRHLMLDATITRRERDAIDSYAGARTGDVGVLNVLVVGSTVEDNSAPEGPDDVLWRKYWADHRLKALPHIPSEVAAIKALESNQNDPGRILLKVDVLTGIGRGPEHGTWSLAEELKKRLQAEPDRYDVVHFAGHALFAAPKPKKPTAAKRTRAGTKRRESIEDDRGYLIFSGSPRPRAVPIATLASWLRNTSVELVYLSCCRSSASRAAAEFARNSIRTTIGFSWDLDDKKAVDFATFFYNELLKNRLNVCSAIRKAREDLHNEFDKGDPIWASPVLLAQPSEWHQVEGVLRPPVRAAGAALPPGGPAGLPPPGG